MFNLYQYNNQKSVKSEKYRNKPKSKAHYKSIGSKLLEDPKKTQHDQLLDTLLETQNEALTVDEIMKNLKFTHKKTKVPIGTFRFDDSRRTRPRSALARMDFNQQKSSTQVAKELRQGILEKAMLSTGKKARPASASVSGRKRLSFQDGVSGVKIRSTTTQRPHSAIPRKLDVGTLNSPSFTNRKRPSSAMSKRTVNTRHQNHLQPRRPSSALSARSDISNSSFDKNRNMETLKRPSSAYSTGSRVVHVLPTNLLDTLGEDLPEEDLTEIMESVAENYFENKRISRDKTKWIDHQPGKWKDEKCIEWKDPRYKDFAKKIEEANWRRTQEERFQKEAEEYIKTKLLYRKQRAHFKSQQQKNLLKSVITVKEPRTINQIKDYIRQTKRRPQSAQSRIIDENSIPIHINSLRQNTRKRPQSARGPRKSSLQDKMEYQERSDSNLDDELTKFESRLKNQNHI